MTAMTTATGLVAHEVDMTFGGNKALSNVTLGLQAGHWHGLIGPNGSGKSTILNVLSGVYLPTAGQVLHDGTDITRHRPRRRAKSGIVRSFQHPLLARSLSLADNVALGLSARRRGTTGLAVGEALELLGVEQFAEVLPEEAPYGARKLAEIARACVAGPRVLLLDEPAAGLSAEERVELVDALQRLRAELPETSVCLVEHDVALVRAVVDQMSVLHTGKMLISGDPTTVLADERVAEVYLGSTARSGTEGPARGHHTTLEEIS